MLILLKIHLYTFECLIFTPIFRKHNVKPFGENLIYGLTSLKVEHSLCEMNQIHHILRSLVGSTYPDYIQVIQIFKFVFNPHQFYYED